MSNKKDGGYFVTADALNTFMAQEKPKRLLVRRSSDTEFIEAIKKNKAYEGVDIDSELARMDAWLLAHPGRYKTQKFIVNWLNKNRPVKTAKKNGPMNDCWVCGARVPVSEWGSHMDKHEKERGK